jgi:hypothetical protein
MSAAIGGDVVITAGLIALTAGLTGAEPLLRLRPLPLTVLLVLSIAAAVILEWAARRLDLWHYRPAMSTVRIAGLEVGLSPLIQVSLLPAASLVLTVLTTSGLPV